MNVVTPINGRRKAPRDGRTLPHNIDAEQSVLGGVIRQNSVLAELDSLEVLDFYDFKHQVVWSAIRNLESRREPIDEITLDAEITKAGKSDALGGLSFLNILALRVPTADNTIAYSKIVRDKAMLRRLALKLDDNLERVYDWQDEADELLGQAIADLGRIETGYRDASEAVPTITVRRALEELEQLAKTPVYATPFSGLNSALGFGGMLAGQVYYVAGGTGFGKTSWIGSVVKHHAEKGGHALVAFYEMFAGYYIARMVAANLQRHSNMILRGDVPRDEIEHAMPRNVEFLDSPSLAVLRRAIEKHIRAGHPPPLVVVDYIQLLGDQVMATMNRPDARLANSMASAGLRAIAKETKAVILVVSAASRSVGKALTGDIRKKPPRDLIDAAKESGAIEYDGAGVIVLSVSDDLDDDRMIATITVAKARFGEAQHLDARYDGKTGEWTELGRVMRHDIATPPPTATSASAIARVAITRVLRGGPIKTKNKIFALAGGTRPAVLSEVDAMVDAGLIRVCGDGFMLREATVEIPAQTTMEGAV